ncbi:hypothetical protein LN042_00520 [Kitasatospora sp. RB6PN24]|uniref:hypothetical protein n=1 Tax=Kitasatospora humi TaxID=2893891 RepID=UPI001E3827CE|nr:hypothetical protein [Kitasatospora humi]MCC9305612.1 hypothetical protein [Kitasatospora humi]
MSTALHRPLIRRTAAAGGLFLLGLLAEVLHAWSFQHSVVEPTRHCRHQGAVPVLSLGAGFLALGLLLATLSAGVRAVAQPVTGGADRALRVLAALLLLAASVLLVLAVLGLIGDFSPGEYDPFNCG